MNLSSLNYQTMRTFILCFILLFPIMGMTRNNPIMIINCGEEDEARNNINTRAPVTIFPCDNGVCPEGTIAIDSDGCFCYPDCSMIIEYRTTGTNDCSDTAVTWGSESCECDGFRPIGCPPWFTPQFDISTNEFIGCEIPDIDPTDCYAGDLLGVQVMGDCDAPDVNGFVLTTVIIQVPPGAVITLADLQNCTFSDSTNFVLFLEGAYSGVDPVDVAFVDTDEFGVDDGLIELEFFRDPTMETLIAFDNTNQDIRIPICPAYIPTMGTWALIILGFLMGIIGVVVVSRRRLSLD